MNTQAYSKFLFLSMLVFPMALASNAIAANSTSATEGNWNDADTWDTAPSTGVGVLLGHGANVTADDVTININLLRIANANPSNATLSVGGTQGKTAGITITGTDFSVSRSANAIGYMNIHEGGSVVASSAVLQMGLSANGQGYVNVHGGNLTSNGILVGNNSNSKAILNLTAGTVTASSTIIVGNGALSTGTIDISGGTLNSTSSNSIRLGNGDGSVGILSLTGGILNIPVGMIIGYGTGSTGMATIDGGTWEASGGINIGYVPNSVGTLNVSSGTLNGTFIYVGSTANASNGTTGGDGFLNVSGGNVSGTSLYLGHGVSSTGTMNITGGNLVFSGDTRIGSNGSSSFYMSDGSLTTQRIIMGVNATTRVNASAAMDGGIINATELIVGNKGNNTGTFTMKGGTINISSISNGTRLSTDANATSTLNIDGGSLITTRLHVGVGATTDSANMRISGSGNVVSSGDVVLGNLSNSRSTLSIAGGSLKTTSGGSIIVGSNSAVTNSTSTLNMTGGLLEIAGGFKISAGDTTGDASNSFANFHGDSVAIISGQLALSPDGSSSGARMLIGDQSSVNADALTLKGQSTLVFSINSSKHSGFLNFTNTGAANYLYDSTASIVIDLSRFSSNESGSFNKDILGYSSARLASLEALVSTKLSSSDRGISNVNWSWKNSPSGGRVLNLSFDYTVTPEQNDVIIRKRKNAYAIRVVTANLRQTLAEDEATGNGWEQRKELCGEVLVAQDADIICLQENRRPQSDYIMELLPDMRLSSGVQKSNQNINPILYSSKRFEFVEEGGFWLSETPDVAGSKFEDSNTSRLANWVLLKDKYAGQNIYVINTHLDHIGAREEQALVLTSFTNNFSQDIPKILTGDFNTSITTQPIVTVKNAGWIDSYTAINGTAEPGATYHAFLGTAGETSSRKKIDFVFYSDLLSPSAAEIIKDHRDGKWPSDHYFVSTELNYTQSITPPYNNQEEFLLYALSNDYTISSNGNLVTSVPGSSSHLPQISVSDNNTLSISFTPIRDELTYEVQSSTDLQTWSTIETISGNASLSEAVSFESNSTLDEVSALFLRVKISPFITPSE